MPSTPIPAEDISPIVRSTDCSDEPLAPIWNDIVSLPVAVPVTVTAVPYAEIKSVATFAAVADASLATN